MHACMSRCEALLAACIQKKEKNKGKKMPETFGSDVVVSPRVELDEEIKRSIRNLSFQRHGSSSKSSATATATATARGSQRHQSHSEAGAGGDGYGDDAEYALQWSAIQRLPTSKRLRSALLTVDVREDDGGSAGGGCRVHEVIDVTKLGYLRRRLLIGRLIKHIPTDNHRLLRNIKNRINRVGVQWPTIEVRYENLCVEAESEIFHGKPIPTLWSSITSTISSLTSILGIRSDKAKMTILNDVSGIIKPGRLTLLLGPPGCGKTSLLKALSGNLNQSVKGTGEVTYNGYKLEEFVPQKTSAYISQNDLHFPEMTVTETIDFAARCHGVGFRSEVVMEVSRREEEAGIIPDSDIDAYMKAIATEGQETSLQTDYILKILGLDSCSDSPVGDALRGGISGGQRRSLTTGEMTVGPKRALFMDQITDGVDGSTSSQVVACLQQLVHVTNATVLVSLLQPSPETFDLFDDIILMSEGRIVYHGPCNQILDFFEDCGFKCPIRKMTADFVQEVLSRKDQAQYWYHNEVPYSYVSVEMFHRKFMESSLGKNLCKDLSVPYDKSRSHPNAIFFSIYSVSKWQLFRACMLRELIIFKRNSSLYVFKTFQLITLGVITMTVFLRTQMKIDIFGATYYMGSLFFSLITLLVDGFPEVSMTVARLPVFHKQRTMCFYPAWAYAISNCLIKIPLSFWQALVWTCLTYYVIGYTPEVQRFFHQFLIFFGMHLASSSLFRFLGSVFQTSVLSMAAGVLTMLLMLLFGGFIITHPSMQVWLKWAFWVSPMTYAEIGLSLNEFLAPRWQKMTSDNTTIGQEALGSHGLFFNGYMYWVSVVALFGFTVLFNTAFAVALTFVKPRGLFHCPISLKNFTEKEGSQDDIDVANEEEKSRNSPSNMGNHKVRNRAALPFTSLALAFEDVQYYIDTPSAMKKQGFSHNRLQLLSNITGTLQPSVLTALMGVSGAGKTTLLDVLSGRKTSGYVEGQIKVGGYPRSQKTFSRILGYCEQNDIHSPQITIEESLLFSAWLRLPPEMVLETKAEFVNEVLEAIELKGIKDSLVGNPGINGLSPEQRKRLTIAVELVANPSIIFMDEPTTGLDARAAGIVMRAVKNVADTGRTILCIIHQPRIDIFESFDELILLKKGGNIIYHGPLGQNSRCMIEYFEAIPGVPKIRNNYNPATWMLEVTSPAVEGELGMDFARIYKDSALYADNKVLVKKLSIPPSGSEELHFPTQFPQNGWVQFKCCLWKQHLSYWRSPSYNLTRILFTLVISLLFGVVFCNHAKEIKNQQDVFIILGSMYSIILYLGIYTCSTTLPYVATERTVMNRERSAGMYSSWSYPLAQVAIEVPYIFIQAIMVLAVTYPLIGYSWSAYKVLYYLHAMFCSLLVFKCLGMLLVSITPNVTVAAILVSACFPLFNLFSGYLIPRPNIPKWWMWPYYMAPSSWLLNGLLSSQFGDVEKDIVAFGKTKTMANFLNDYFGYHHDFLPVVAVVLSLYPLLLAFLFAFCMGRLKFNKR